MVSITHPSTKRKRKKPNHIVYVCYIIFTIAIVYLPFSLISLLQTSRAKTVTITTLESEVFQLRHQLQLLETKLDSFLSFGYDPFQGFTPSVVCSNITNLEEYCPKSNDDGKICDVDQTICLDNFPFSTENEPCIVYDFGIRKDPEFGEILSKEPFNCKVYAFDPSPITTEWYEKSELRKNPNYQLFDYGAGGEDETIMLNEYNWDQVTIYQYPQLVVDPARCDEKGACKYKKFETQKRHHLPVRSLSSIMNELGHDKISILKLDVEGSEYRFLESAIDSGACQNVDQLTLEWHHYDYDRRYGTSSSPHINMFVALLDKRCGLKQFDVVDPSGGWPANDHIYTEMEITLRYNLASFMRVKENGK